MKLRIFALILLISGFLGTCFVNAEKSSVSTKKERNYITKGNSFYNQGRYLEAQKEYQAALKENPSSIVGRYNLGLSQIRLGSNPSDTTQTAKDLLQAGIKAMQQVANNVEKNPSLASKANYNLGNVAFSEEDYKSALNYYKQSLRLNPDDDAARRNLRITQLKIQEQENEDNNQDNQDNQDQDQDNQDNQDNQDQNDQNDQNEQNPDNQQNQNQDQQQPKEQEINQQTAEQIMNAMENKENQTRARIGNTNNAEKSKGRYRTPYNW